MPLDRPHPLHKINSLSERGLKGFNVSFRVFHLAAGIERLDEAFTKGAICGSDDIFTLGLIERICRPGDRIATRVVDGLSLPLIMRAASEFDFFFGIPW